MTQRCFVGLGSNLGDGPEAVRQALAGLADMESTRVTRCSSLYRTAAWGRTDQPDFTNAVAELSTGLNPEELLGQLLQLETLLGRSRNTGRWGPRHIDLDLLTYEEVQLETAELVLPHPRMHERAFVLVPLLELVPSFRIPGLGSATEYLQRLASGSDLQAVKRIE